MNIIQIIIQGGAVGLAGFSLYIIWKLTGNHLKHNTKALQELTGEVKSLKEVIKDKL